MIHKPNGGKPSALNVGIEAARGEALIVLDDDDRVDPGALQSGGDLRGTTPRERDQRRHPLLPRRERETQGLHAGDTAAPTANQSVVQQVEASCDFSRSVCKLRTRPDCTT